MIGIYQAFTKAAFRTFLAYRSNFYFFMIGSAVSVVVALYLWLAIFDSSNKESLNGFTRQDFFVYIILAEIIRRITFSAPDSIIAEEIKSGAITTTLLKPLNYQYYVLFTCLGRLVFELLCLSGPIVAGLTILNYAFNFGIGITIINLFIFILSCVLSYFLIFSFNLIIGYLSMWLNNLWGLGIIKGVLFSFFSGAMIPISFFPEPLKMIVNCSPFPSAFSTPLLIFLGKLDLQTEFLSLGFQLMWVLLLYGASQLAFFYARKAIAFQGG